MTTVQERVKMLMEHYHLSVYRFAARVGEDRAEKFYNILKGKMKPNFDTIQSIGNGFPGINIDRAGGPVVGDGAWGNVFKKYTNGQ